MIDPPYEPGYFGRPSVSPVLATLVAAKLIRRSDKILLPGCGHGTDARQLARWGFTNVVGVDAHEGAIKEARSRAVGENLSGVEFRVRDATKAPNAEKGTYDAIIDTLLMNNLTKKDGYLRACAALLRPGGLFVLQRRDDTGALTRRRADPALPLSAKLFQFGREVTTLLPEYPTPWLGADHADPWAVTSILVGYRRGPDGRVPRRPVNEAANASSKVRRSAKGGR